MENNNHKSVIELHDVVKRYKTGAGEVTVLKEVSLTVYGGEFVSVMGPSGSGKSTLLNMITGIDKPNSGAVFVTGQPIHAMSEDGLARWRGRNVGVIFQFFQLLPALTMLENVVLPMDFCRQHSPRERRARAMELLELVGIGRHAHKLPSALSGGEQQRGAIARALATEPPLIVADEPTGNLDTRTASEVIDLFQLLVDRGKTILLVTHDPSVSARTQRIIHLLDGEICKEEQLKARIQPVQGEPELKGLPS